ncbi:F-box protein At5g49610 [Cryptomeria japonica]|uniref:F-box protein At5g49610 n=1 Tax=Cryptomeria japonica TaxID=3369 RepID=UPI0027DA9996|nr:F-box protein At5g49610 [Cryptomeria japonica]
MDMNSEIWGRLPEELVMIVLAKLPTLVNGKFRAVCKQWKLILSPSQCFQRITQFVHPSSTPAFLIGRLLPSQWINFHNNNLYLLQPVSNSHVYKLSLEFLARDSINVVTSCKSVLCCSKDGAPTLFYLCNPVTKTWKKLPPPTQLRRYDFIGLSFDCSTRTCILIIGRTIIVGEDNNMVMEIYNSQTNAWTKLQMNTIRSFYPLGEGVYSRGNFYWNNSIQLGPTRSRLDVVSFDVRKKYWDVITRPQISDEYLSQYFNQWQLSGYDGKVVLVYKKDLRLWRLNEDVGDDRWSELPELPRSLCREVLYTGIENDFGSLRCAQVVVNSSGWICVHLPRNKIVVFDEEGRVMQKIEGRQMTMFTGTCPTSVRAFEINNVWWP